MTVRSVPRRVAASVAVSVGFVVGGCLGCGTPGAGPGGAPDGGAAALPADVIEVTADSSPPPVAGPRALEAAFLGRGDAVVVAAATAPAGLAERLELLAAVVESSRARRIERLEALADESDDRLVRKTASRILEQDDAWLAGSIDAERFETFWSSFGDGVARTVGAAVQGNPVGVVRPLVEGVDGLLRPDELDALDRKQLALSRRWLVTHPDGAGLPAGAGAVRARTEELRTAVFEQELRLFDRLLEEGRLGAASAHLHVASVRRPHDEEVRRRTAALEAARADEEERRRRASAVAPKELELRLADADGFAACRRLAEDVLLGRAGSETCGELAAAAEREGWGEVAASLRRAAASWESRDPWRAVRAAEEEVEARRRRFLWTGERPETDPRARYRVAADPGGFRATDLLTPIFWVPATLARAVSLAIGRPVDDRPVVDALAAMQWTALEPADRERALRRLVDRYVDRGEAERAYTTARGVPSFDEEELAEFEDDASEAAYLRADAIPAERVRRAALAELAERSAATKGGARARERLAEFDATADERTPALPATALAPLADALGLPTHLVDGRHANGEVEPPGFRRHEDRLTWELEVDGERRRFERRIDAPLAAALAPLEAEQAWRRRVAATESFQEAHEGIPIELRAGAGLEGISVLPRLLPEVYRGRDRRFFEP